MNENERKIRICLYDRKSIQLEFTQIMSSGRVAFLYFCFCSTVRTVFTVNIIFLYLHTYCNIHLVAILFFLRFITKLSHEIRLNCLVRLRSFSIMHLCFVKHRHKLHNISHNFWTSLRKCIGNVRSLLLQMIYFMLQSERIFTRTRGSSFSDIKPCSPLKDEDI
jgi:hypothetical protein